MAESSLQGDAGNSNPRGIPYALFVDNVEDFVSSPSDVQKTLNSFQELISKYRFMEVNQVKRAASLKDKVPDIQETLDTVRFLKARKPDSAPIETFFELNDTLYAKACVPPTEEVYLWLGANVMLAYTLPEAEKLLESKLSSAKQSLANCEEDMDFLREQITTMEVNIARVYNWDIMMKRKENAEGGGENKEGRDKGPPPDG